eukprot:gb/GFBE01052784.1/.p1 GENE.gb/GFBE01052784.1/~~gb/GFBE01052784.1/.p1  ORF type:complete len:129 (+),score=26.26 gb/GFBE01052784.1/:1-387(+)
MALRVKVTRAMTGDVLCEIAGTQLTTVLQLKESIARETGIPHTDQRLLSTSGDELRLRGQAIGEVLDAEAPEVALVVRQYDRKEMQAAWLIEGIWKRNRRHYQQRMAASHIANFWRARQHARQEAQGA